MKTQPPVSPRETGSTCVETLLALSLLVVGLLGYASLTVVAHHETRGNSERRIAIAAARSQIERLRAHDFSRIFAAFDETPANDPPLAQGPHFDVPGLETSPADPDGRVGRIVFPTALTLDGETAYPALREDVPHVTLGMPADLDGDGLIDDGIKDASYTRLPVLVEVCWQGVSGSQVLRVTTWLTP